MNEFYNVENKSIMVVKDLNHSEVHSATIIDEEDIVKLKKADWILATGEMLIRTVDFSPNILLKDFILDKLPNNIKNGEVFYLNNDVFDNTKSNLAWGDIDGWNYLQKGTIEGIHCSIEDGERYWICDLTINNNKYYEKIKFEKEMNGCERLFYYNNSYKFTFYKIFNFYKECYEKEEIQLPNYNAIYRREELNMDQSLIAVIDKVKQKVTVQPKNKKEKFDYKKVTNRRNMLEEDDVNYYKRYKLISLGCFLITLFLACLSLYQLKTSHMVFMIVPAGLSILGSYKSIELIIHCVKKLKTNTENLKLNNTLDRYLAHSLLRTKGYCSIEELVNCSLENNSLNTTLELNRLIKEGLIPYGYIDQNNDCMYLDSRIRIEQEEKENKLKGLNSAIRHLTNKPLKEKCKKLYDILEEIYENNSIQKLNKKDIEKIEKYYLPSLIDFIMNHSRLSNITVKSENIESCMKEIEDSIDDSINSFNSILKENLDYEIMDLSTDVTVYKQKLKLDGLME